MVRCRIIACTGPAVKRGQADDEPPAPRGPHRTSGAAGGRHRHPRALRGGAADPSEIIVRLPRFIPEHEKYHLGRAEAVASFTESNRRGYIGTIWYDPFPYIHTLCSRRDFGITSIYRAEYVIGLRRGSCNGCLRCVEACPAGAITVQ